MKNLLPLAVAGLVGLGSSTAMASPVTHSFSATIDPTTEFVLPGPFTDPFAGAEVSIIPGVSSSVTFPFNLADGDTVEMDISVTGPGLTLTDAGFGLTELLAFGAFTQDAGFDFGIDNPGGDTVLSYDRVVTVTVDSFSGALAAGPLTVATALENVAPAFSFSSFLNFTDSSVTLFDFTITATYSNFVYGAGFESYAGQDIEAGVGSLLVADKLLPVPAPGALALLGFGLLGFNLRRRTK